MELVPAATAAPAAAVASGLAPPSLEAPLSVAQEGGRTLPELPPRPSAHMMHVLCCSPSESKQATMNTLQAAMDSFGSVLGGTECMAQCCKAACFQASCQLGMPLCTESTSVHVQVSSAAQDCLHAMI